MKRALLLLVLLALPSFAQKKPAKAAADPAADRIARIGQMADELRPKLVAQRRDFHMNPELSNREERTSKVVAERLRELGLTDIKTGVGKYGVTALLVGGRPGPVVAVRADMDALPINEVMDVPYKSKNPGVKHACGHDIHTTVELGVAEVLMKMRDQIPGTIKFIFQPAEEGAPAGEEGGAPLMIKEGALENPRPLAIYGLHVMPTFEVGSIAYTSGSTMASSDKLIITIKGRRVHAAYPHEGLDPIPVAAQTILALQTIRSRRIDTLQPMVISIGMIQGGNRNNIIAEDVRLEGTIRTLDEDVRKRVHQLIREIAAGVAQANGATASVEITEGTIVTYNDPKLVEDSLPIMRRVLGEKNVLYRQPQMGAEDFSYFQKVVPGFYYFLGVGNKAKGITAMIHTPEFDADENSLLVGVKVMANTLVDFLERNAPKQAAVAK